MIPLKADEDGANEGVANPYHPFMRGAMEFDDYNYKLYNPYVLLKEPEDEAEKRKMAKLDNLTKNMQSDMSEKLSVKAIEKYDEDYQHDVIMIEPSEKEIQEKKELEKQK